MLARPLLWVWICVLRTRATVQFDWLRRNDLRSIPDRASREHQIVSNSPHAPNLRHGTYSRLPLATLPKRSAFLRRKMAKLRAALESAVERKHGTISTAHALVIHAAVTHQTLAELWLRRLRDDGPTLSIEHLALCSDRASREVDKRDAAIARLSIDQPPSIADQLFGQRWAP